jgi:hypothetical protein
MAFLVSIDIYFDLITLPHPASASISYRVYYISNHMQEPYSSEPSLQHTNLDEDLFHSGYKKGDSAGCCSSLDGMSGLDECEQETLARDRAGDGPLHGIWCFGNLKILSYY